MSPSNLKDLWIPKNKWLKYLKNNGLMPIMEVLDEGDETNYEDLEIYWITQFKTWGFKLKNDTEGGKNANPKGKPLRPRTIEKLKKAAESKSKPVCQYLVETGKLVKEYKSITEAEVETKLSHVSECCLYVRKTCGELWYFRFKGDETGYIEKIDYWTGAHHTEESVEKMKMNHPFRKEICQYSIETDELIEEYKSLHEAENETGIARKHISNCCKGKENCNSAGGYYWRFKGGYYWRFKGEYFKYVKPSNKKQVIKQYDINHILIKEYTSMRKVTNEGYSNKTIKKYANKNILYNNYYWEIIY